MWLRTPYKYPFVLLLLGLQHANEDLYFLIGFPSGIIR